LGAASLWFSRVRVLTFLLFPHPLVADAPFLASGPGYPPNKDLLEAQAWYANIRPELGERFALAVAATVEAITEHPWRAHFPGTLISRLAFRPTPLFGWESEALAFPA